MDRMGGFRVVFSSGDLPRHVADELIAKENGNVGIDIETSGLNFRNDKIGSIQVFDGVDAVYIIRPPFKTVVPNLNAVIESEKTRKIFHHAMFDLRFLAFQLEVKPKNIQCTKIAAKIVIPDLEKSSLVNIIQRYLGLSLDKGQQQSNWMEDALTPDQVLYAVKDVIYLPRIRNLLMKEAGEKRCRSLVLKSFEYIPTRVALDISGQGDVFIY